MTWDGSSTDFNQSEKLCNAFIVAGGKGSRLGKIGEKTQKCMLNIWDKPILYYTIVALKYVGCTDIVISVNYLSEQIIEYFGDGSSFGVRIRYVKQNTKSTYESIYQSLSTLSDRILYAHANILFDYKLLKHMIALGNKSDESVIAVVDNRTTTVKHAQVDVDEHGYITRIDLKERNGELPFTFLGIAYYKKSDFIENLQYDKQNNVICSGMVEKVIQQKMENGKRTLGYHYMGEWTHIETEADYNRIRNENRWEIYSQ